MKTDAWGWHDARGLVFQSQSWAPDGGPRAVLALVHGLGEHSGRYAAVGGTLAEAGYALVGFDLRGHGLSGGPRGHTPDYDALLDDIAGFLTDIKLRLPRLPLFLYGHSLGGNLVLNFAMRRRPGIRGVIVTSPWLRLAHEPPVPRLLLARLLNLMLPAFTQAWDLEAEALSHDGPTVQAYDRDPLVHDRISARMFVTLAEAGRWALDNARSFPLPLLLMHGSADEVTSPEASAAFAARLGETVTWRCWEGLYHELHNEVSRDAVLGFMVEWLDGQLKPKSDPAHPAGQKAFGMREFGAPS